MNAKFIFLTLFCLLSEISNSFALKIGIQHLSSFSKMAVVMLCIFSHHWWRNRRNVNRIFLEQNQG